MHSATLPLGSQMRGGAHVGHSMQRSVYDAAVELEGEERDKKTSDGRCFWAARADGFEGRNVRSD